MLTTEQIEMRRTGIGASEIAAVCGVSPWDGPLDVWLRKTGRADEKQATPEMHAGNMLERAICDWYAVEMGGPALVESTTLRHPRIPYALATPDRVWRDDPKRLVQAKNVGLRMAEHWGEDPDAIPEDYRLQIEWEMEVAGADRCDVVVLIGGQRLRIYPIYRDRALAESLLKIAGHFWEKHVLADVPPDVDASEGARRYLERKHPRHITPLVDAPDEAAEWAARYAAAMAMAKAAEEEKDLCGNHLRKIIGDAEGIRGPWGKATWKANRTGTVAWKALAESFKPDPNLIQQYTSEPTRSLRVYPTKKEK